MSNRSTLTEQPLQNNVSLLKMVENLIDTEEDGDVDLFDEETEKIRLIIQGKKFNKDETSENGHTILMVLIEAQNSELALELIKSGMSNPSSLTNDNDTALILSCYNNLDTVASELIKTGESMPEIQNNSKNTALIYACYNGMEDVVFQLIETGKSNPGAENDEQETALTTACANAYTEISLKLLETGQSNPGVVNNQGETALILACQSNMPEVAFKIIETGEYNPGIINNEGSTALIYACGHGLKEVSLELIETGQSNPGALNNQGRTALFYACKAKMSEVALELIKTRNSNPGAIDEDGFTSLIGACLSNLPEVALELIKTGQSNPSVSVKGTTALIIACSKKQSEVAIALIKTGLSNPNSIAEKSGLNALQIATNKDMTDVVKILKDKLKEQIVNINDDGYNFATMDKLKIKDYLNENINNLCFRINNQYYFTDKPSIITQINDNANIKFGCISAGYNDFDVSPFNYTGDENILYDEPYLSLSSIIGLQIFVKKIEIDGILNTPYSTQIYNIIPSGITLKSIISAAYINGLYGASADHCQPEKQTEVYTLVPALFTCNNEVEKELQLDSQPEPIEEKIKIQYKGKILKFPINIDMTLKDIKILLLKQLFKDGDIDSENQKVKFIYKGKIYPQDDIKLLELDKNPFGITLQSVVTPIVEPVVEPVVETIVEPTGGNVKRRVRNKTKRRNNKTTKRRLPNKKTNNPTGGNTKRRLPNKMTKRTTNNKSKGKSKKQLK